MRDYEAIREETRILNDCREGDTYYINTDETNEHLKNRNLSDATRVTVVSVHEHFVVVRFPAGFCQAYQWQAFNAMRRQYTVNL